MSYAFPKDQPDGTEVELANGVTYKYSEAKNRWAVAGVNNDQIIKMITGGLVAANFGFEWNAGKPTSRTKFTANNTDPRKISKLYMHRDFMEDFITKDGYVFKNPGIISIQDASSNNVGLYHCISIIDNGGSDIWLSVAGTGTASSFTVGSQYRIRLAVTFPT